MVETTTASVRLDEETKDYYMRTGENFNSKARDVLSTFKEAEEELGLTTDMQDMELVVLRTYKSAIHKNIQTMQAELDKINNLIEDRAEDEEVTVVELHLGFDNENV